MKNHSICHLVLCGGSGTRLWPLSRKEHPKQFLKLFNGQSTFQRTLLGNKHITQKHRICCNVALANQVKEQVRDLDLVDSDFVWETASRNTAPALLLASLTLEPEDIVLATPSDHLIEYGQEYYKAVEEATLLAKQGHIVTFGIAPTTPHTGYGYLEYHKSDVLRFHEKPSVEVATAYLSHGNFLWNSGIYCFKVKTFLEKMQTYAPEIYYAIVHANEQEMQKVPEVSIDYALMEKLKDLKVIPARFSWNDVGSFESLQELDQKNEKHFSIDSNNTLIMGDTRAVALVGVSDLIVIDTPDALLVAKKGASSKVKELLPQLEKLDPLLCKEQSHQERPWGSFTVLEKGPTFKVKKITVHPGKRLSLQRHEHRWEHWVVVAGRAKVVNGDTTFELLPNQSTYIPVGQIHRIENPGDEELILIEVQYGSELREDDIIRIEDDYQRSPYVVLGTPLSKN